MGTMTLVKYLHINGYKPINVLLNNNTPILIQEIWDSVI